MRSSICHLRVKSRAGFSTSPTLPNIAALRFGIGAIVLLQLIIKYGISGSRFGQIILISALGGLGFAVLAYSGFALAPDSHGGVLIHGALTLTTAFLITCFVCGHPKLDTERVFPSSQRE
jgi:hypothetical protein